MSAVEAKLILKASLFPITSARRPMPILPDGLAPFLREKPRSWTCAAMWALKVERQNPKVANLPRINHSAKGGEKAPPKLIPD